MLSVLDNLRQEEKELRRERQCVYNAWSSEQDPAIFTPLLNELNQLDRQITLNLESQSAELGRMAEQAKREQEEKFRLRAEKKRQQKAEKNRIVDLLRELSTAEYLCEELDEEGPEKDEKLASIRREIAQCEQVLYA
jgi:hypothetical protein